MRENKASNLHSKDVCLYASSLHALLFASPRQQHVTIAGRHAVCDCTTVEIPTSRHVSVDQASTHVSFTGKKLPSCAGVLLQPACDRMTGDVILHDCDASRVIT